ncbi:hypothetical protein D3C72_1317000 [compost metagenome]
MPERPAFQRLDAGGVAQCLVQRVRRLRDDLVARNHRYGLGRFMQRRVRLGGGCAAPGHKSLHRAEGGFLGSARHRHRGQGLRGILARLTAGHRTQDVAAIRLWPGSQSGAGQQPGQRLGRVKAALQAGTALARDVAGRIGQHQTAFEGVAGQGAFQRSGGDRVAFRAGLGLDGIRPGRQGDARCREPEGAACRQREGIACDEARGAPRLMGGHEWSGFRWKKCGFY